MKNNTLQTSGYSTWQITLLTVLRVMIGWHFLYEGLVKIFSPAWSAESYLKASVGPFSSIFHSMAESEVLLQAINLLNAWGLVIIGLCLFIGLFSKLAKILGIVLLAFYYLSFPPFPELGTSGFVDGNYWVVNRNLIEIAAIAVLLVFPTSGITGIDRFIFKRNKKQ